MAIEPLSDKLHTWSIWYFFLVLDFFLALDVLSTTLLRDLAPLGTWIRAGRALGVQAVQRDLVLGNTRGKGGTNTFSKHWFLAPFTI